MAPGNDLLQRRLGREMTMFETRNAALGGSKTADNLADADALGIDPSPGARLPDQARQKGFSTSLAMSLHERPTSCRSRSVHRASS